MQPKKNAGKKARWTRTQKNEVKRGEVRRPTSERGRPARGGASRFDNDNRGERRSFDRRDDNRSFERRDDRGGYQGRRDDNRGERSGYQGRRDDSRGFERRDDNRGERGGYQGRRDDNRGERSGYQGRRDDRGGYQGRRDDSRGFERRDDNRGERGGYQGRRDDRGGYQGRRDDSRGFERRDDNRGERGGYQGRRDDSRGGYQGRRDDRPSGERSEFRGQRRWDRDDNRGGYQGRRDDNRGERGGYQGRRDDNRGERSGSQGRDDRRSFDRNDRQNRRSFDSRPPRFEAPADRAPDRLEDDLEPTNEAFGWVERQETDDVVTAEPIELGENGFAALGLPDLLVARLARDGITQPFPIQQASIPDALEGRDVLGRGRTGSGKTLAFGLPLLTRLAKGGKARAHQPRSIIMVPTRELAMQVSDALQPLVHVIGLRHKLVAGGMPYEPQLQALERGVDVLVATPGRLKDLIDRGAADLSRVEVTVLDEADHMAEMGFLEAIEEILDFVPADGQRLLFSATLDRGIDGVVEKYLTDPAEHSTDDGTATVTTMAHHALLIEPRDKKIVTAEVANRPGRTVVFARTKLGADRVAGELRECGVMAAALHGGLNQSQRNRALSAFRDGRLPVLVATDVAARGIHVDDVGVVLQIDPPADHKDYLHRSGRTARAGEQGVVVSLVLPHQRRTVQRLLEQAGVDTELQKTRPGDEVIAATGGSTPEGNPISDDDLQQVLNPGRGRGRGGGGGRRGGYRDDRGGGYGRRSSGHGGGYGGGRGHGRGQRSDRRSY
ncbi:DEAD/DEAH box helicase [Yimella sp. cx-51]|uniref:DEAD/DEAH box helicase n=1 Tax=Yimella sp. cx-51 TaxID=2770551 RepID=UPI00165DC276|nr:DEAD/DEAH box helicase [Yimella sp. cx-51]MBC9956691.1 DEAD/DEAH box helicase [Yimella sp. cx-51]QTH38930.1 DEAD/DEAH box helicase [Yimella sp. cx-51]